MEQNANDLSAALGGAPVQPAPGPAATSLDPALQGAQIAETPQPGQIGAVEVPQQAQPQPPQQPQPAQPAQPQFDPNTGQPLQQPPQVQVAPNAPNAPQFVNPDPNQGINEPQQFDPQTGQPIAVVAPANQPAPISAQAQAQAEQQDELSQPPTVPELAECANALRTVLPASAGPKVAALLDRVAEARIQQEAPQQQQFDPQTGQPVQRFVTH